MPDNSDDLLDLEALTQNAEEVPDEPVEAEDYVPFTATPPGRYISPSRVIKGRQRDDHHFTFQISLQGGIVDANDSSRTYEKSDRYPLTDRRCSTKPFQDFDRGITSGASKYLRAFGISTKGVKADAIPALMLPTQTVAVGVSIGRGPKSKDVDGKWLTPFHDGQGNHIVADKRPDGWKEFRTKDFRNEDGTLKNSIEAADQTWDAKATVEGYFPLKD